MVDKCDVPDAFRISHVSAIPKIFNPTTYSHYRPISAMSEINKAADRVIREMIEKHLKLIKFLPDEQYGFRTGYSTTKQMVIFMEDIVKDINDGKTIDIIFIDMVKAFDTMTTAKIAEQLEKAKIRGKLLKLIICFLEHRRFLVKVNGVHSDTEEATSGAPQGGVLSAVLFIIFFQKLSEVLNEEEIKKFTKHYKFADDLKLKNSYFLEEFDRSHMQKALDLVSAWCNENSMSVNAAKTVHVQYGSKNSEAKFFINDTQIIQQNVTRDLGLYINNDLTLDTHVENISKTANGKMFSILRKVITNDPKILTQIFTTYIRPNYEYASSVFNISQRNTIIALEAIQKLFTRILYQRNHPNVKYYEVPPYSERLKMYEMQSLHHRRIITDILLAYDMVITHPNKRLDLIFHETATRNGGHYSSKTTIYTNKLAELHFSSRIFPILNKYKLNLHEFRNKESLRFKLQTIDFSEILINLD